MIIVFTSVLFLVELETILQSYQSLNVCPESWLWSGFMDFFFFVLEPQLVINFLVK